MQEQQIKLSFLCLWVKRHTADSFAQSSPAPSKLKSDHIVSRIDKSVKRGKVRTACLDAGQAAQPELLAPR